MIKRDQNKLSELDELRDRMKRMVYLFSHDMRNPLVNMKALLSEVHLSLQDVQQGDVQTLERELPDMMNMLDQSVDRMSAMVDGANDIYHCMFDPLECEAVELKPLVERVAHRFDEHKGLKIEIGKMGTIWADPLAVTRIVEELLKNSIQAIGHEGSISISLRRQTDFDEVVVSDSGIGLSQDGLERLFDPFYSGLDQPKSASGVGLAIVKALMEAHGGAVRVDSKHGEGTVLYVSFPTRAKKPLSNY